MAGPNGLEMMFFPEIERVNSVCSVENGKYSLGFHLHVVIAIPVAAKMKVARHFLHCE